MLEDDLCYRCPDCQGTCYGNEWNATARDSYSDCESCGTQHQIYTCPDECGYTFDPIFSDGPEIVSP